MNDVFTAGDGITRMACAQGGAGERARDPAMIETTPDVARCSCGRAPQDDLPTQLAARYPECHAVATPDVPGQHDGPASGIGGLASAVALPADRGKMPVSAGPAGPDVLLFVTTEVNTSQKRLLRFRAAFLKAKPDSRFVVVTFDAAVRSRTGTVLVRGVVIDHYILGVDAVDMLGYPEKGRARPFNLIPGNSDLITLAFRKLQPQFRHYWFLEDDVEYSGDPADLFADLGKRGGDLLATHLAPSYDAWAYAGSRRTPGCDPDEAWLVFLPFYRVSADALDTIDEYYRRGWTGHHENMWATILIHAGRTVVDIGGQGEYVAAEDRNRHYYGRRHDGFEKNGSFGTLHIRLWPGRRQNVLWHPVKPFRAWLRQRKKRLLSKCQWVWKRLTATHG